MKVLTSTEYNSELNVYSDIYIYSGAEWILCIDISTTFTKPVHAS